MWLETYRPWIVDDPEACSRRRLLHIEPGRDTSTQTTNSYRSTFSLQTWRWPTNRLHLSTGLISFWCTEGRLKPVEMLLFYWVCKQVHLLCVSMLPSIHNLACYLQVLTPTFVILTVMAAVVPSCSIPKSTLDGRSWNPPTVTFGSVRETGRLFLLTGSLTDGNWNRRCRQSDRERHVCSMWNRNTHFI